MSTEVLTQCQLRVSFDSIDQHSTVDAFSSHNPISFMFTKSCYFNCTRFHMFGEDTRTVSEKIGKCITEI